MSRTAVIYTRVSTKEQADTGTSLADQEKVARKFCKDNGLEVIGLYEDDCSGKSFDNRPGFNTFFADLKAKSIKPDVLLVARMDRFSRDTHNTLNMWKELKKYGVELMTCDSNFDLAIPENFLPFMLQVILPQVENERRGLNTRNGMRSKIREGRYMGKAPRGYDNVKIGDEKCIMPNDIAPLVKLAFEEVSKQLYPINEIRRRMRKKGLMVSQAYFYVMLKNIVYKGKLLLKAYRDEPEKIINGLHEPIIDERLFNKVQDVLNGKKKPSFVPNKHNEGLPLRRLAICSECGIPFTGSCSKGGSGILYNYYHCQKKCRRYRASQMNDAFIQLLKSFEIPEAYQILYKEILMDLISSNHKTKKEKLKEIDKQIQQYNNKLIEAEDKLLDNILSDSAYKRIEERYGKAKDELLVQRVDINCSVSPMEEYVVSGMTLLADLPGYYTNADAETKSMIISSIFPEKLIYDGEIYRTPKLNAFIAHIHSNISLYERFDKKKALNFENLSSEVAPTRIELVSKV